MIQRKDQPSHRFGSRWEAGLFLVGFGCLPAAWLIGGAFALLGSGYSNDVAGALLVVGILLLSLSQTFMRRNLRPRSWIYGVPEMMFPSTFRAAWRRVRAG